MKEGLRKPIAAFHLFEIIAVWFSPFLLSWYIIIIGIILNYIQIYLIGDCILTKLQFGKRNKKAYYTFLLEKIGFRPDNERVTFFVINIKPYIILLLALVWQKVLGNPALLL